MLSVFLFKKRFDNKVQSSCRSSPVNVQESSPVKVLMTNIRREQGAEHNLAIELSLPTFSGTNLFNPNVPLSLVLGPKKAKITINLRGVPLRVGYITDIPHGNGWAILSQCYFKHLNQAASSIYQAAKGDPALGPV